MAEQNIQPVTRSSLERELQLLQSESKPEQEGLFGPESAFWSLGRHSVVFLGAGRSALLQLAHPWVANAIDQHSQTRDDPLERFRSTFRYVLAMGFGSRKQAIEAALSVHTIHSHIEGVIPRTEESSGLLGKRYMANEANAMIWVHATLVETSVLAYELIHGPLEKPFKERYYQDAKRFAQLFGIPTEALPTDWDAFMDYNRSMWESSILSVGDVGRDIGTFLFDFNPLLTPLLGRYKLLTAMIMPPRLRDQFQLPPATHDNLVRYEKTLRRLRKIWAHLPQRLRYLPTYFEAQRRLQGKTTLDPRVAILTRLMLGCNRLVD